MNFRREFIALVTFVLVPLTVFGQTTREKYQEAKAAEFRSDNTGNRNEREAYIGVAFGAITEAVMADPQYVGSFATITRKYIARRSGRASSDPYFYIVDEIEKVGKKRAGNPVFKAVVADVVRGYKQVLLQKGFAPGRPLVRARDRFFHCNVPTASEHIYKLSRLAYPANSNEVVDWGMYAADAYMNMTTRRGCGGEGGDLDRDPFKAFAIYTAIKHFPGMQTTGKMVGDHLMRSYIFGGYDGELRSEFAAVPGYRPFYQKAMDAYRTGAVPRDKIRSVILGYLREAEKNKDQEAIRLAEKTLAESF